MSFIKLRTQSLNKRYLLLFVLLCGGYIQAISRDLARRTHHRVICALPEQRITLVSSFPRGSYQWSTGEITSSIVVSRGGIYTCVSRHRGKRLEEVFDVKERRVSSPSVAEEEVICKVEEVTGARYPGLLWYRYGGDDATSGRTAPPDVKGLKEDFSLYVARKDGGCLSEKKEIRFVFLDYMLCPDFINRHRSR